MALCTKKSVSIGGGGMVKLGVAAVVVVIGFILKVKAVLGGGCTRYGGTSVFILSFVVLLSINSIWLLYFCNNE